MGIETGCVNLQFEFESDKGLGVEHAFTRFTYIVIVHACALFNEH